MDYFFGRSASPKPPKSPKPRSASPLPPQPATTPEPPLSEKKLRVRIGPTLENLQIYNANDDAHPHFVDSEYFCGHIVVRVKKFNGFTPDDTEPLNTDYFGERRRTFSIQFSGRFKQPQSVDDVVFGGEFQNKVNPPPGTWVALKFANLIDPALLTDVYSDKPWLYSPMLCSMNTVNVIPATVEFPDVKPGHSVSMASAKVTSSPSPVELLGKWTWGDSVELKEDNTLMVPQDLEVPIASDDINERRKYFRDATIRQETKYLPDRIYNCEIFAPVVDFNTFDLNLGINVNLLGYLNNQPITLYVKSLKDNTKFFVVDFELVHEK